MGACVGRRRSELESERLKAPCGAWVAVACLVALAGVGAFGAPARGGETAPKSAGSRSDGCVACHANPDFLITNKKLYEYYQDWKASVHADEGVTCVDCHGGDPKARDKERAHAGASLHAASASSAISYRRVAKTCGRCHAKEYDAFRHSEHQRVIAQRDPKRIAPNCVTCHGSVATSILRPTRLMELCSHCHNRKTQNHPGVPLRAARAIRRLALSERYYRFVSLHADEGQGRPILREADLHRRRIPELWHRFDLAAVEREANALYTSLKAE